MATTTVTVTDATLKGSVTGPTFTGSVDGAKFTGNVTYEAATTPPPDASGPTGGLITQFNPNSSGTSIIDGLDYSSHTYGGSYAKTKIDDYTIRFEIHQGDVGWSGTNNSMLEAYTHLRDNTAMKVAYRIMIEPGAAQTASWMTTVEWHNDDTQSHQSTSPPAAIEILGEKFSVVARYPKNGNISSQGCNLKRLWTQPQNIVRGQWYVFEVDLKFSLTDGYLKVKVDGQEIANHSGQLGYGFDTYLMFGLYREQNPAVFANQIRNMTVSWAK